MSRTQFEEIMGASKRVFVPGASGEPQGLLDLLSVNPALSQDFPRSIPQSGYESNGLRKLIP